MATASSMRPPAGSRPRAASPNLTALLVLDALRTWVIPAAASAIIVAAAALSAAGLGSAARALSADARGPGRPAGRRGAVRGHPQDAAARPSRHHGGASIAQLRAAGAPESGRPGPRRHAAHPRAGERAGRHAVGLRAPPARPP